MADNGHKRKDKVKEKQKMGIFDRFKVLTVNDGKERNQKTVQDTAK